MTEKSIPLTGDLTIYRIAELREEIETSIPVQMNIIIDVKDIREIDITGIQLFISLKNTAENNGKKFKLINIPQHMVEAFTQNGLEPGIFT